ncbi:hypothetical protein RND81_14G126300 [Saponaria officinalis]|uniref:Pectinesterase inhibitor domain-containing protein n=1 Tax=Saponaria officinalis TaxID=3572 RepID=A0AAW1GPT1_SAPOF
MELMLSKHTIFLLFAILSSSLFISTTFSTPNTNYSPQSKTNPNNNNNNNNNNHYNKNNNFVKIACNTTTYPTQCIKACLPYASKIACDNQKLAAFALSATFSAAKAATTAVTKLSHQKNLGKYEVNVVRDCIENMGDSIDELKQSIKQMNNLGSNNNYNRDDLKFKVSNIQTWMSGAITNENTCMDEIKEKKVRKSRRLGAKKWRKRSHATYTRVRHEYKVADNEDQKKKKTEANTRATRDNRASCARVDASWARITRREQGRMSMVK